MLNEEADFEAAFEALREHLQEVRPIFDKFAARHNFEYLPRLAIGRYPRIRIQRRGAVTLYFDLWMQCDEQEKRFEEFRRDLPYDLYAGAVTIEDDGSKYGIGFHKGLTCFSGTPLDQVGASLEGQMEQTLPTGEAWDVQYVEANGQKVRLGGG